MKKYDIVRIINERPYLQYNLKKNDRGIILDFTNQNVNTLFFNPNNIGDYAIANLSVNDVILENEKLTNEIIKNIEQSYNTILKNANKKLEPLKINAYDMVELLVENEKYSKYGVHKGDKGCVMNDCAVQNYIDVDFSGIDKNGKIFGDCISVKIDDLKILR